MKGCILINNYSKNKSQLSKACRLKEEFLNQAVFVDIIKNNSLAMISGSDIDLMIEYDFCVFLDKDKSLARMLEKCGMRLFNSSKAIEACDNKMYTHIALSGNDVLMPKTMYAPLCYFSDAEIDYDFLSHVASNLLFPLIAKLCYGSLGNGVFKINNMQELINFEIKYKTYEHIYQEYIECNSSDTRVIVIGNKVICAMKRYNDKDFRSNIEQGGSGIIVKIDDKLRTICEKISLILQLDYCGIDILTDSTGNYYLCEVNSNAFFSEMERVTGLNIAKKYAEYILKTL